MAQWRTHPPRGGLLPTSALSWVLGHLPLGFWTSSLWLTQLALLCSIRYPDRHQGCFEVTFQLVFMPGTLMYTFCAVLLVFIALLGASPNTSLSRVRSVLYTIAGTKLLMVRPISKGEWIGNLLVCKLRCPDFERKRCFWSADCTWFWVKSCLKSRQGNQTVPLNFSYEVTKYCGF